MSVRSYKSNNNESDRENAYLVVRQDDHGRFVGLVGGAQAIKTMYGGIPLNACQIGEVTSLTKVPGETLRVIPHEELEKLFANFQTPTLADVRAHDAAILDNLPF